MGDLSGKVALITGSGRGMGRAHALVMAGRGADIVIHDILEDEAAKTAEDVRAYERDGAVCVRGCISAEWLGHLRRAAAALEARPGPSAEAVVGDAAASGP